MFGLIGKTNKQRIQIPGRNVCMLSERDFYYTLAHTMSMTNLAQVKNAYDQTSLQQ